MDSADGRGVLLAILLPGEVFGEIALLAYGQSNFDAHAIVAVESRKTLFAGSREGLTWCITEPSACRAAQAPSLPDVRLKRRMASTVEMPIADLAQGIADQEIASQTALRYPFKSIELLDFCRGQVVFRVSTAFRVNGAHRI